MQEYPKSLRYLVRLLLAVAVVGVLIVTRQLLIPLVLAVLLAYLLYPSATWLEEHNVPRILTNFIVILSFMAGVVGTLYILSVLTASLTQDVAELKQQFQTNMSYFKSILAGALGLDKGQEITLSQFMGGEDEYLGRLFNYLRNIVVGIALVPVYTFLLLFYRNKFKDFIFMMVSDEAKDDTEKIINRAAHVVPKYLKGLLVVCLILVGLNSIGFYIIGLKYALLLGLVAAIFNLIPYVGTIIGYGIVFLFVLSTQSPSLASGVIIQFFIVQFIENNILTPNITGSYVRLNPLVIIFSLIASGMVWGIAGMFIIIPVLGMLKIVCENVEELKPISFLLGTRGTEKYSITVESLRKRFGWTED